MPGPISAPWRAARPQVDVSCTEGRDVDRRAEARTVVRRLLRRDGADARWWAAIGAVWAHLVALGVALQVHGPTTPVPSPPPVVELVVLAAPAPSPEPVVPTPPTPRVAGDPGEGPLGATAGRWEPPEDVPEAEPEGEGGPPLKAQIVRSRRRALAEDPVEELRRALGWAAIDRENLPERSAVLSLVGPGDPGPAAPGLFTEPDVAWEPAPALAGAPLGDYVATLERAILERWSSMDLDVHARAIGIQGDVTVRYRIRRSGTTSDVRVVRSSGLPSLDGMAIRAIPARLPRIPDAVGREELHHEITLRYRNP
jgi:TonB family protein